MDSVVFKIWGVQHIVVRRFSEKIQMYWISGLRQNLWYALKLAPIWWSSGYMYLARSPTINFYPINTDSFWIHAPYRIWDLSVKSKSKNWGFECQKWKIQTARFPPFLWYIICISQGFMVLPILFLSQKMRFIAWGYTFTVSAISTARIFYIYVYSICSF